ncbi:DUF1963 domain-containing protein [Actinomadura logoneensis]|uniref:DUF1963 domain-containing protein n=1 Tax=Actinomadura logoneensis TaxID=2293572 RepID=A0A372JNS0_9ACTN|nr:DUF1963 domain-containing protein [Actinomadura logoneensis]RFU41673.1 DUF1963 domain-containing protein [Actinomadura logoneensis]
MDPSTTLTALHEFCTERLGPELAHHFMKMARPGFDLVVAAPEEAAGDSRFGGMAMLEPGTPWPTCDGFPLSLLAVLDTDALPREWLGDLIPAGTGLLNFFFLDTGSEQCHEAAFEVAGKRPAFCTAPELAAVIAARSSHAVPAAPPARASVFAPVPWAASPGFAFPNQSFDLVLPDDLGPEAMEMRDTIMRGLYLEHDFPDWEQRPGALTAADIAFAWPVLSNSPPLPDGKELHQFQHLLQISGPYEWGLGADGGDMHWTIPTEALRTGDFSRAIPTPDYA